MSWNEAYALERRTALDPLDDEFRKLPAALREEGRLFRTNLLAASGAEDLAEAFSGPHDYPGLYLHYWVSESLPAASANFISVSPAALTRAAFYTSAAVRLFEDIADPASLTTDAARPLQRHFRDRAVEILAGLHPGPDAFRQTIESAWSRFDNWTDRLAPLKLPALSAWHAAGRGEESPHLNGLLDQLNGVYRFVRGFRSLRRDLLSGRRDRFVHRLLRAARISPGDPAWAERLMGAMVLTDMIEEPIRAAEAELDASRAAASELGLGGFEPYLDHLQTSVDLAHGLFKTGGRNKSGEAAKLDGFERPAVDVRRVALASAESFLLTDPVLRESREIHRYGLFGRAEIISRFPAGLALEILCETGHTGAGSVGRVDEYLASLAEGRFGYFDPPAPVLRDADTLGLALRLRRYAAPPDGGSVREELDRALSVMEQAVRPDARIPVWLEAPPPGVRLAGEGCGVVEAHLLLGLIAFDAVRFEELIARSAAGLLARFEDFGPGISINYPALYALDVVRRLVSALDTGGIRGSDPEKWPGVYRSHLAGELDPPPATPQDAAFAMMACTDPAVIDLDSADWPVLIRKRQRSDGSWNAEPFCFTANRGNEASWYSSRTLTTAFCYRALKILAKNKD